ncbi:MAG: Gfo/Idh/MocA family oxidoreductase [Planctomycetaceae bacterium]|nr:Gfo/Idh/MocA family oxidoreductase [Planctomycetaceae bacterium]
MTKPTRRSFLKTAAVVGSAVGSAALLASETNAQQRQGGRRAQGQGTPTTPAGPRLNVACIGIGGKGDSDANNAARFGNIVAICDVDRGRLEGKARQEAFQTAKQYTDFRELLTENENNIDMVVISGPDHMHGAAALMAMRMGKHCFIQKPLTRTIYEARIITDVAKETGVCTQMGNQGTAIDNSRNAIDLMKAGIIGTITEVIAWSNRPVWPQRPNRRETMASFAERGYRESPNRQLADRSIWRQFEDVNRDLQNLDWRNWISVAPYRDYFPGLYHAFNWRGWWDFGSGALGDMACHMLTVPYAAADLKDPTWVRARSSGHDFDSYPAASVIEFEFPATADRGKIPFWWYDRRGNTPPAEIFAKYGITGELSPSGVLIIGEKGAMFSTDDYCENRRFLQEGGQQINEDAGQWGEVKANTLYAEKPEGGNDVWNMYELYRAIWANDPSIAQSNVVDRAGPLTETILLGNLAVWAAAEGGDDGALGEWGEKIEWDAKNLVVTNLADLKTPGVADLVKPVFSDGYRLD